MVNQFSRTQLLLGKDAVEILGRARVAVFGVGGVGGFAVEAMARSGIQHIDLIDNDTVSLTNLNRQIIAMHSTIGMHKVDVMKSRILDINPNAKVGALQKAALFSGLFLCWSLKGIIIDRWVILIETYGAFKI